MLLKIRFYSPFGVIGDEFWFSPNFYFHLAQCQIWHLALVFFFFFRRIRIQNFSLPPGLCCGGWLNLSLMTVSVVFSVRDCFALHQSFILGLQWAGILYKICIPASRAVCLKSLSSCFGWESQASGVAYSCISSCLFPFKYRVVGTSVR